MCDGVGGSILNPYDRPGVAPPIMLIGSLAVYLLKVSSFKFEPARSPETTTMSCIMYRRTLQGRTSNTRTIHYRLRHITVTPHQFMIKVTWHIHDRTVRPSGTLLQPLRHSHRSPQPRARYSGVFRTLLSFSCSADAYRCPPNGRN